jgi:aryl-alcohol dehydrogenase-like predicted oxidoreductase
MRMRSLGSKGPDISVIGFGAWEAGGTDWGPNASDEAVIGAMRAGFDAGITWIDTAEVYGDGVSERLVGKAISGRTGEVFVATKVAPDEGGSGFRPEQVAAACEGSLSRLGIDHIDLYQLHWPDSTGVPLEDTWGAMLSLQETGKVGHVGVSNFDRAMIETCERLGHVDSLQQEFSLLALSDRELIAWCADVGTGVVAYGPLAFGMLSGRFDGRTASELADWRSREADGIFGPANLDANLRFVQSLQPIAARLGITLSQLAIAWVAAQPGVTSAIVGSRNPDHVRSNAGAGDVELDDSTLEEIEALIGR